jgi:hypothetical protein
MEEELSGQNLSNSVDGHLLKGKTGLYRYILVRLLPIVFTH